MRKLTYSRSRPSYSSRPSSSPSRYMSSKSRATYHGTRSRQAAFFYRYPVYYFAYTSYMNSQGRLPKGCDEDELKLKLANGTVMDDRNLIHSWFANTTMYENITAGSQVSVPCEHLNMASILGISLGIGIPVMLIILCCVCIPCLERRAHRRRLENSKASLYTVNEKPLVKRSEVDMIEKVTVEEVKPAMEVTKPAAPILKPRHVWRSTAYADEFLHDSSYIRHVARILDYDYEIPRATFEWLEYNQPQLYNEVRESRKEGMPEKRLAIKVMQCLVNTHFVTTREKEKLKQLYPHDVACIMSLDTMTTI